MSQRRKRKSNATKKSPSAFKWVLGIGVVLLVALVVIYQSAIRYLHSDGFRITVAEKISETIGAPSELGEMQWSMLHMENEGFHASSEGALQQVDAKGISLNVENDFLTSDAWNITDVLAQTANLEIDLTKDFTTITPELKPTSWIEKQLPKKAALHDLEVIRADAKVVSTMGDLEVKGTSLTLAKEDYGYSAEVLKGALALPLPILKSAELVKMKLRMLNQRVVIDFGELAIFDSGRLELDGEVDFADESIDYELNGWLTGLLCRDLISEDWKQRLSGKVESKFTAQPDSAGEIKVRGNVVIRDGQLTALPVLDTIAAYTAVRDFKTLRFSEFRCDYVRHGDLLRLNNIYMHCNGLMRIEGQLDIKGSQLAGTFQVGLNPGTLGHIPGAEDKVFLPGKEGMSWTNIRIGGTLDDIEEDLSDRMLAAAGERLFEMVGGDLMLKFGGEAIGNVDTLQNLKDGATGIQLKDAAESMLESSKEILDSDELLSDPIKSGTDLIQSGLGGFFGGSSKSSEEEE